MCGIWASVGLQTNSNVIDSVSHRGPDGGSQQAFETIAGPLFLAHKRLAIFDTSVAGKQPMRKTDRPIWIVFNGAIYNFIEIRQELQLKGHSFKSNSDTEVLLSAYAEWGPACLKKLNGMFAFVIWDEEKNRLFAARDRFGVKPLYYKFDAQGLAFSSEIKQITALQNFQAKLEIKSAHDFLAYGYINHQSKTMFSGVHQLKGGEYLDVNLERWPFKEGLSPIRWYSLPNKSPHKISEIDAIEEMQYLFVDSVKLRLRSDVPVGYCLSGGLDSSSIVSVAASIKGDEKTLPPYTFSAAFNDTKVDESTYFNSVIEHTNAHSHIIHPQAQDISSLLEKVIYHHDLPFPSTSMIAQWMLFEAARKNGVSVILDGQGADEHLCGYHSSFAPYLSGMARRWELPHLAREMIGIHKRHKKSFPWQIMAIARGFIPSLLRTFISHKRQSYPPSWMSKNFHDNCDSKPRSYNSMSELMRSHMEESSLPGLLHYEDRNSMAHGIESRLPFLDYRLVEFSLGLGERFKIVEGETKWLLRRAMSEFLPKTILNRQDKIGFSTPENLWFQGEGRNIITQGVNNALEGFPDLFNANQVSTLKTQCLNGSIPFDPTIWRIACFGIWGRVFNIHA